MRELENIPQNSKIAIYGAGEAGVSVKKHIEKNRPDLNLVCFFDKNAKEDFEGKKVYQIEDITHKINTFDFVVIASYLNFPIMEAILKNIGVKNYIKSAHLPVPLINKNSKTEEVKKILNTQQSKEIFELVVNAYTCKNCLVALSKYLKLKNLEIYPKMHEQYFDFINAEVVKTVISGGAYDGGTTLLFLDRFVNAQKIYAFEPMYEKFKCELNEKFIEKSNKVEIIKKGLFDKSTNIGFDEFGTASKINSYVSMNDINTIQTLSIDDFVSQKNIQKVDFIKMDLEGCEMLALKGAAKTIREHRPQLAICIYHSYDDLFDIPLYLGEVLQDYRFEIYHYSPNTNWETVLYAIPTEISGEQ